MHCNCFLVMFSDLGHTPFIHSMGGSRGGVSGVATSPNGQSHNIKCSTTDVLSNANALITYSKMFSGGCGQVLNVVVKPLSRLVTLGFALGMPVRVKFYAV